MNDRQRFHATMHYLPRDRGILTDFGFWDETIPTWHTQGLPNGIDRRKTVEYFGMDYSLDYIGVPVNCGLEPAFPWITLEDRGDHEVVQQHDGVRVLRKKFMGSIPTHLGHLLVDRDSWERHYKPRLDPTTPGRFPADWEQQVAHWRDADRPNVLSLPGGSLYGWLRDWMGMEKISLTVYDDPQLFAEMVGTLADCILGVLEHVLQTGGRFDACGMWEDMCYRAGPLLSPRHFKQYLVPHYRRIADLLHRYNVDILWLDCDGNIDALLPLWLDAGVNCLFPIEIGTWGADPLKYRRQYGKDLRMMGGFDKHILAKGKEDIRREVERLAPLVEEGGYMGFADHRVPPDVPLENYIYYIELVRAIWGKGISLKPVQYRLDDLK